MTHDEFDAAYKENLPRLIRLAGRILRNQDSDAAKDVVADAMCRCLASLDDFVVIGKASATTWMTNAVVWVCKNRLGRQRYHSSLDDVEEVAAESTLPACYSADMNAALDALPQVQRRVIDLLYLEGYTYDEASGELGMTISQVRYAERLGLDALRHTLEGYYG